MRSIIALGAVATLTGFAAADIYSTGFDGPLNPLGSYGNVGTYGIVDDGTGNNVLYLEEDPMGGTPQLYLAWITGLSAGDTVTVTASAIGEATEGSSIAKARLWGHYTNGDDITSYLGSAGGGDNSSNYIGDEGVWETGTTSWTFDADANFLLEGRIYSYGDNNSWMMDDLIIELNSSTASVNMIGVPAPGALALVGLAGIASRRRRA
tara:strand:- start:797 stop:1420 length:624 start_codon:yes stop_codon:yes gene_type:complete